MKIKNVALFCFLFSVGIIVGLAANMKISYQDSWVLEGIEYQVFFMVATYIVYVMTEEKAEKIAIISSVFILVLHAIPGLKYEFPYGLAIDQGFHLSNLRALLVTGLPEPNTVYSDQPGLSLALASMRLFGNLSPDVYIKFGPGIIFSTLPLIALAIAIKLKLTPYIQKYVVISCAIAIDPYFTTLQATSFGSFLFLLIVFSIIGRDFFVSNNDRVKWTSLLMILITTLVLSHAITVMVVATILVSVSLLLPILSRIRAHSTISGVKNNLVGLSGIVCLVFGVIWWVYKSQLIFRIFVLKIAGIIEALSDAGAPAIPARFFALSVYDQLIMLMMYYVDFLVVVILAGLGLIYFAKSGFSKKGIRGYELMIILFILFMLGIGVIIFFGNGQIEYARFIGYIVVIAPFPMALGLIWLQNIFPKKIGKIAISICISLALVMALEQAFPYQPIVPSSSLIKSQFGKDEPVVYMHSVMSAYQIRMLDFAEKHLPEGSNVGADIVTYNASVGLWGGNKLSNLNVERAIPTRPITDGKWNIFLYHRPGIAGPLYEQDKFRTMAFLGYTLYPVTISIPYDNGGSFILIR
jgi:hypothetical protein